MEWDGEGIWGTTELNDGRLLRKLVIRSVGVGGVGDIQVLRCGDEGQCKEVMRALVMA